jgi:hypothetical protein
VYFCNRYQRFGKMFSLSFDGEGANKIHFSTLIMEAAFSSDVYGVTFYKEWSC